MVAAMTGLAVLVLWLVAHAERRWPMASTHPLVALGRASLTIFILHVPLFRELTRPFGYWRGLSATATLATIGTFAALSIVVAMAWRRVDYRWGAEWVLRKVGG
jgi:peptidoglycan/LPS O-acetylase OafA/YrhL